jgi:membrane associated rhomboid family serine protease
MASFANNVRDNLKQSDTLQKLLIVNIAVFLLINILKVLMQLFMVSLNSYVDISNWLAVPASLPVLITRPWTLITYMFLHEEFFHILFNMLWLYWMGKILQEYLGNKKLLSTYILGGISGALMYIIAFNVFPLFSNAVHAAYALGASASVLAITVAAATLLPDYPVHLLFLGRIPLKYIAIATILLDLISISGTNAGGHLAHLGGAMFGFVYIRQLRNGYDLAGWFNQFIDWLVTLFKSSRRSKMKVSYKRSIDDETFLRSKKEKQELVDELLDKISKSGYGSLTKEEKDFLFKSSREN